MPYDARRGPSFVGLARKTTADLHPRALLDVLIGAGAAELREGDVVALTRAAYVPQRGRPEALAMLADDPPELIETMLHNVLGDAEEARLQQKLAYDNIGSDGLGRLRAGLRREADRFLAARERAAAAPRPRSQRRARRVARGPPPASASTTSKHRTRVSGSRRSPAPAARKRIRKRRVIP